MLLLVVQFLCAFDVRGIQSSFITLRDYDFVGEDQRLTTVLAERIELLRRPVDLAEIEARIEKERALNLSNIPADFVPKPDHMQLDLRRFPKVNVSMDYGEISNISAEMNSPLFPKGGLTLNITEETAFNMNNPYNMSQAESRIGNLTAGRRAPTYHDPSLWHYDVKLVELMKQNIYMAQTRFLEIQPIVEKYQTDDRFKIAYLFNRLDEWRRDIRTAYYAVSRPRWEWEFMHVKQQILYYEHMLRKDIDITYSIEFLNHLHGSFMVKMKELIPSRAGKDALVMNQQKQHLEKFQASQG